MSENFRLLDLMPILSTHFDFKLGVDGNFVGQFKYSEVPYKYLILSVKCVYPMSNGEKEYTAVDLISEVRNELR